MSLWYSERIQPLIGCVFILADLLNSNTSAPPSTPDGHTLLPFEGAPLHPVVPPGPEGLEDATHPEVHQLDQNPRYRLIRGFESRFLADPRDVQVYLPQAYLTDPGRRFPVFYLHDGQNLFDGRTSYVAGRTWRAHTTADALAATGQIQPVILVGIDNTGLRRMAEYTPTRDRRLGGGEGQHYGRLLTEELKPLIDRALRTLPDAPNTALGGSSLGGLISLALGLSYPAVFGKLAVLSPSVWWDSRSILATIGAPARKAFWPKLHPEPTLDKTLTRIWLSMGTAEGLQHLRDCDLLHRRLLDRGWQEGENLRYLRVPGALHNEEAWADCFGEVLQFLFPPAAR